MDYIKTIRRAFSMDVAVSIVEEMKRAQMHFPFLFQFRLAQWSGFRAWAATNEMETLVKWIDSHVEPYHKPDVLVPMQCLDGLTDLFFLYLLSILGEDDNWQSVNAHCGGLWSQLTRHGLFYFTGPNDDEPQEIMCTGKTCLALWQAMVTAPKKLARDGLKLSRSFG